MTTSSITSFRSLYIPVPISHRLFYLKVMDNWQTQEKCVGFVLRLPNVNMQVVETYNEVMT